MFKILYILIGFVITMKLYGPSYKTSENISNLAMFNVRILSTLLWPGWVILYSTIGVITFIKFIKYMRDKHEKDISNSSDGNSDGSVE